MNPVSVEAFDIFRQEEISNCDSCGVNSDCESETWSIFTNFFRVHHVDLHGFFFVADRCDLRLHSTWIGIRGGWCLETPCAQHLDGHSRRPVPSSSTSSSTTFPTIHTPPTSPSSSDPSCPPLPRQSASSSAMPATPTDTLVRFDRTSSTALGISSFSTLPMVLPCVLQICVSLSSLRLLIVLHLHWAFPLLPSPPFPREVSHDTAIVTS